LHSDQPLPDSWLSGLPMIDHRLVERSYKVHP
jgi:hypothetical protein